MIRLKILFLIGCFLLLPIAAFGQTASSQSSSSSDATAVAISGQGGTAYGIGIGIGGSASVGNTTASVGNTTASVGNTTASVGNLSAETGSSSVNLTLDQIFEAAKIPRDFPIPVQPLYPGLIANFGPYTSQSWNVFPIGIGKVEYNEAEAERLLGEGKGIESYSTKFEFFEPTKKVRIVGQMPKEGVTVGFVLVRGTKKTNHTNEVLGQALLDAMKFGATMLVVLKNGADIENQARSAGIGIGNVLSIISGGAGRTADAVSGGTGYTAGSVGQKFFPYIHGIAIRDGVPPTPEPIKPEIKISPMSKFLEREKEQTVLTF